MNLKKKLFFNLIPTSIYIHIPWCIKKCPYCDFHSHKKNIDISESEYINHLIKDLKENLLLINTNRVISSIFIGGGTPSLLSYKSIEKLLYEIKKNAKVAPNAEISIEINPRTIETKKTKKYKKIGINRFSIGVQSFNEQSLKKIERESNVKEINKSIKIIESINPNNFNLDLMHSLPAQSVKNAIQDIKKAISFNPDHISWYQLSIEPNTPFYKKPIILPSEEKIEKIFFLGNKELKKSNYIQYEISSYSKKNKKCKHNLNYWRFGDYIGIGCGAHGKITLKNGEIIRTIKKKQIYEFINGNYIESIKKVPISHLPFEYFMNTCRIFEPIKKQHFLNMTNIQPNHISREIKKAIKKKYLIDTYHHWMITKRGRNFLNSLIKIFIKN